MEQANATHSPLMRRCAETRFIFIITLDESELSRRSIKSSSKHYDFWKFCSALWHHMKGAREAVRFFNTSTGEMKQWLDDSD